ncbi:MAG TPA: DUF3153 domain-containing protein [Bacilli bacterium]|nr:DUF3153 domain-containing protein [Bacilli bacterium]
MRNRGLRYWLVLFAAMLLFTGCVKGDLHTTLHKDGSADLDFTFLIDSGYLAVLPEADNPLVQMKQTAEREGYRVTQVKQGEYAGLRMQKTVDDVTQLSGDQVLQIGTGKGTGTGGLVQVTEDDGFFYTKYNLSTHLNLDDMAAQVSGFDMASPVAKMFVNKVDFHYRLTLPSAAGKNNATRLLDDDSDGYTYEWDVIPGQDNEMQLQTKVWHMENVSLSVGIVAAVMLGVVLRVFRKKNRMQKASTS